MYPKHKTQFLNKSIRMYRIVSITVEKTKQKAKVYIPKILLNTTNRSN